MMRTTSHLFCLALALLLGTRPALAELESTRLSLPKGPGSIEGLASSDLTTNLASGQATYTIPIAVPPAARSFGPSLALSYDSGAGAFELGVGWRLSGVPSIRRRVTDGLPRFDDTDSFEVLGLGVPAELLEVEPGVYRPRYEDGSFLRAVRHGDEWEVRTKAGQVLTFGGAEHEAREGKHVATYLLRRAQDLRGHEVRYEWRTDGGYPLLERIVWNELGAEHMNEVAFAYEARPDPSRLFSSGIRQLLRDRMVTITVRHGGELVRRYELSYHESLHSQLASVVEIGADGTSQLPASRFGYSAAALETEVKPELVLMSDAPGRSPAELDASLADLNGDGLPDLLIGSAGGYRSVLNRDGRSWEPGRDWAGGDSPSFSLAQSGVQLADFDGDGALDLLSSGDGSEASYLARPSEFGFQYEVAVDGLLGIGLDDPNVRLADFDGDRRIDVALTTDAGLLLAINREGIAFDWSPPTTAIDPKQVVSFEQADTELCDINGDRVQDICVLRSGSLIYYLGRGRGVFEPAEEGAGVPQFESTAPFGLRDLDGDGWDDLVRVGSHEVTYALAEGEGIFGPLSRISDVPTKQVSTHTFFADMNGSGSVDIVWVDVASDEAASWRYLELFPHGRAGLLTDIDNGLGKRQTIEYAPAASFAAEARESERSWDSRLNLALPVVARVTAQSAVGDPPLVQEYSYIDGVYDVAERTFAAFAAVEVRAFGDESTPTLVTEQRFETGLLRPGLRGALLFEEKRSETGDVFLRQTHEHTITTLELSLDGRPVDHAYRSALMTEHVEGDEEGSVVTLSETEQDEFGNVTLEQNWGVIEGDDYLALGDEVITVRTFANDEEEWVLGHWSTETVMNGALEQVAGSRRYYDGPAFEGLPLGRVTRGEVTREEAWVGPGRGDFELVTATRYDAHGLPLETKDARGGGRLFTWNAARSVLLAEAVKLDIDDRADSALLIEKAEYDTRFGKVLQVTDYGGSVTSYRYDAFGRLTAVIRPGDSEDLPTLRYSYDVGSPLSRIVTEARIRSGEAAVERREDSFDGFGRKRASLVHDAELWLLAGVEVYDARGQVHLTALPRWVGEGVRRAPPLLAAADGHRTWRDALGREVRTLSAEGVSTRTSYGPLRSRHWDGGQTDETSSFEHTPTVSVRDGIGRTVRHERTLGGEVVAASYAYDAAGRLLSRTDPEGNVQTFGYDGRGRRVWVDDPDQGQHRFAFDAAGNLSWHEHPDGHRSSTSYDLAARPISEDWDDDGVPELAYEYDSGPRAHLGKLVRVTEPSGFVQHSYDARGRVNEILYQIEGHGYVVGSRFDAQDRENEHIYPDGSRIQIRRNARGQLSGYGELVRIEYGAQGGETLRHFSSGAEMRSEHDQDNRRLGFEFRSADDETVEHLKWAYDHGGNLISVVDARPGVSPSDDRSETYRYDNLYRLTGVTGAWGRTGWAYSPSGNLLARSSDLDAQNTPEFGYGHRPHAATSAGSRELEYDASGRLITDGERTYEWDGASHLVHVSSRGGSVDSVYGHASARRLVRTVDARGGVSTRHFIDGWSEVKDGQLVRYVVHGSERIVRLEGSDREEKGEKVALTPSDEPWTRAGVWLAVLALLIALARGLAGCTRWSVRPFVLRRYAAAVLVALVGAHLTGCSSIDRHTTGLVIGKLATGDVLLITDQVGSLLGELDERGEPRTSLAFLPYGYPRHDASLETNKYAGTPRDGTVQLDHMGARFYAADLGTWTSPDPIALSAPENQVTAEFGAAHPYAYANHRPLIAADRDGRFWQVAAGALIGAAFDGAIEALAQYSAHGKIVHEGRMWGAAVGGALGGALIARNPSAGLAYRVAADVGGGLIGRAIASGGKSVGTWQDAARDALGPLGGAALKAVGKVGQKAGAGAAVAPRGGGGLADDAVRASTPVGRRGAPLTVPPGTNAPATIGDRNFTGHAFDQMQSRGFTPTVVENAIEHGARTPGNQAGTFEHVFEGVRVITNEAGGVVTVIPR